MFFAKVLKFHIFAKITISFQLLRKHQQERQQQHLLFIQLFSLTYEKETSFCKF
jgi:hypothetical protein